MSVALTDTRQKGERKREEWLADFAKRSVAEDWTIDAARAKASSEVVEAEMVGNLKNEAAKANVIRDGVLAAHPDVRNHFNRLVKIRDELWNSEPDYLRSTLHGPSQILVELMRRQKKPSERHHTKSAADFLEYLRKQRFT
jgi:hypothetical protein